MGADNFFLFGLTAEEVVRKRHEGYRPKDMISVNNDQRETIELIDSGFFSSGDRDMFRPLTATLCEHDEYMLCADRCILSAKNR